MLSMYDEHISMYLFLCSPFTTLNSTNFLQAGKIVAHLDLLFQDFMFAL